MTFAGGKLVEIPFGQAYNGVSLPFYDKHACSSRLSFPKQYLWGKRTHYQLRNRWLKLTSYDEIKNLPFDEQLDSIYMLVFMNNPPFKRPKKPLSKKTNAKTLNLRLFRIFQRQDLTESEEPEERRESSVPSDQ